MRIPRQRKGQSAMEYIVLVTFVVSAMIVMTPWILGAVNGMFHGYEDGIKDSFREPLNDCIKNMPGVSACPGSS